MAPVQYRLESFEEPVNVSSIAASLSALGADGWHVVGIVNDVQTHTRRSHAGPGGTGPQLLVFMEREGI